MKKKQEGNVQYVNFTEAQNTSVIPEKTIIESNKKPIPSKSKSSSKVKDKIPTTIVKQRKKQKNTISQHTEINGRQKQIREFMQKCEVYEVLNGKHHCSLAWSSDATNREIYTKALKAVLKAAKSPRKFKMQQAS